MIRKLSIFYRGINWIKNQIAELTWPKDKIPLRIAIISTPRSGNTWLRMMLSYFYDAKQIAVHHPNDIDWDNLPKRNCILQLHWHKTGEFVETLQRYNFRIVVLARNPLDVMISILHFVQNKTQSTRWLDGENGENVGEDSLNGKTPASPEFAVYAKSQRAMSLLSVSYEWAQALDVKVVCYEDMVANPELILKKIFDEFGWTNKTVSHVVRKYSIENLRPTSSNQHFWKGEPGIWKKLISKEIAIDIVNTYTTVFPNLHIDINESQNLSEKIMAQNWKELDNG